MIVSHFSLVHTSIAVNHVNVTTIVFFMEVSFRSTLSLPCLSNVVELCSTLAGERYYVPSENS